MHEEATNSLPMLVNWPFLVASRACMYNAMDCMVKCRHEANEAVRGVLSWRRGAQRTDLSSLLCRSGSLGYSGRKRLTGGAASFAIS